MLLIWNYNSHNLGVLEAVNGNYYIARVSELAVETLNLNLLHFGKLAPLKNAELALDKT